MKHAIIITLMSLLLGLGGKELRVLVLTPTPQMHCESCENKIKKNMRFEKGVKKVETDLKSQHVTITYDPTKTNPETLKKAIEKLGYKVE